MIEHELQHIQKTFNALLLQNRALNREVERVKAENRDLKQEILLERDLNRRSFYVMRTLSAQRHSLQEKKPGY
jgi:hypothetical protein